MVGHIAVVKGRGAACALGAAFAMDAPMMALDCVPLVGGSLLHHHAEAVPVTAFSLPLISLALHRRRPSRALGPLALISILFAARLKGTAGAGLPDDAGRLVEAVLARPRRLKGAAGCA